MDAWIGGCQCKAFRYQCAGAPAFSLQCCCRQCQYITGTGHASQFGVPKAQVKLSGPSTSYALTADSGNRVLSHFCPTCGSPLYKETSGFPDMIFLHVATLDDPNLFSPNGVAWQQLRRPWDHLDPNLQLLT